MAKKNLVEPVPNYNAGEELPYRNQHNYDSTPPPPLAPGPSMTVRGQAYSVKEIMERALGGIIPERKNYEYFDVEDIDNINEFYSMGFDLTDLDRLAEQSALFNDAVQKAKEAKDNDPEHPDNEPEPPAPEPEPEPEN